MTLTFFPSVHISCRFPMPQGLYTVLKKYRDGKGLWRSLMANVGTKNGGRKGTRKYWEDTWNRAAEFPCTFLFPQLLRYWDFYCQHVLVNCSLRIVILGWTSIWYWYYNSWHCSTTLVILCWVVVGARRRFVAIVDASTCKYIQTLLQKNKHFWVHVCKWMHRSFVCFCVILYMNAQSALHREELISATDSFAKINMVGKGGYGGSFWCKEPEGSWDRCSSESP